MEKINNLKFKFKDFPKEIEEWFRSNDLNEFVQKISNLYKIDYDVLCDLIIMLIENDFYIGPIEKDIIEIFNVDENTAVSISKDLLGMIFYPANDFIKEFIDIEEELKKRKSTGLNYLSYKERFNLVIERIMINYLSVEIEKYKKQGISEEEISHIKDLFKTTLVDMLKAPAREAISILNANIIYILQSKPVFKEELLRIILQNKEQLTSQTFKLEGKVTSGTIENWIKDFTIKNPTNVLDNIALSGYMVASPNISLLDNKEKKLVNNLLLLYRNLKGFPQFFANIPIEQWQIFPLDMRDETEEIKIEKDEVKVPNLPFTKDQMKAMTAIEKMIAMQEYGISELDWNKLIG